MCRHVCANTYKAMKCIHLKFIPWGLPWCLNGKEFTRQEDPLVKEMATDSSILAWEISWMEEPGGLQSMGTQRAGHY